jgi:hypothetical protein
MIEARPSVLDEKAERPEASNTRKLSSTCVGPKKDGSRFAGMLNLFLHMPLQIGR